MVNIPSPAVAIVARHNSGKTTLIVRLIEEMVSRGYDVGSIKHHSHDKFEIDYPGKDSYRHREAGASETVIASPSKMARVKTLDHEMECADIVRSMPGHDIIIVEGYRKSGLPTIELMRSGNEADMAVAMEFAKAAKAGTPLSEDFTQASRKGHSEWFGDCDQAPENPDLVDKMPTANTVAIVTDIPEAAEAAEAYGIPAFPIDDINPMVEFLEEHFTRPRITVVIQAGGESRRMGRSKATVPFNGRPLICRLIERVRSVADELIITTNEPENLAFLAEEYPDLEIRFVSDAHDKRGALPGLNTALSAASNPYVAVIACDMVFASKSLIVAEAIEMAETGSDVVVPVNKHGFEPFHATYRKDVCLPATERALAEGKSRVQSVFDDPTVKVCEFPQEKVLQVEPRGGCFINTNTPDELARIEESYLGE